LGLLKNKEDILFWVSIMRDHAIFQNSTLAPKEVSYIQKSAMFRDFFQNVMNMMIKSEDYLNKNTPSLVDALNDFINFKRSILKGLLTCQLEISLPPSFINHQINEAMEFRFELMSEESYLESIENPMNFIKLLKKWIADSSGHAAAYASFLDPTESIVRDEALKFKMNFDTLSVKANELQMMMMQSKSGSEALMFLVEEVAELMKRFVGYLKKILKLRNDCKIMAIGTLTPLLPDHMIREHEYILSKIDLYMQKNI
jgi:hypothetical protein